MINTKNFKLSDYQNLSRKARDSFEERTAVSVYNDKYLGIIQVGAICISAAALAIGAFLKLKDTVSNNKKPENEPEFNMSDERKDQDRRRPDFQRRQPRERDRERFVRRPRFNQVKTN